MSVPFTDLPEALLCELRRVVPEFTLVGSFARDYWVHSVAGLPRGARTVDVDVTILVSSMAHYRERLTQLVGPTGTGIAFRVQGFSVDVIPYGPEVAPDSIVEPIPGVTLDVTGIAESVQSAQVVPSAEGTIQIPALSS